MPQQRLIGTSTSQVPTNGMLGTLAFMNAANAAFPAPVSFSLGSAAAPSIAFTGDPNTGIYSPGADQVAISTAGSGRLFVDASGLVGVGTSAPVTTLTVNNNSVGTITNLAYFCNAASSPTTGQGARILLGGVLNNTTRCAAIEAAISDGSNGHHLAFLTQTAGVAPQERARIDASGRLLVGTSNTGLAGALAQVEGGSAQLSLRRNPGAVTGGVQCLIGRSRGSTAGSYTSLISGDTIGTLFFQGADGTADVTAASIAVAVDGTPGLNDMPGRIVLSTTADGASSPTERMRITAAGLVGVGTSSPGRILSVSVAPNTVGTTNSAEFSIVSPGLTVNQINSTTIGMGDNGIISNFAGDLHLRSFWGFSIDKGAGNLSGPASNTVNTDSRTFAIRQFAGGTTWNTQFCVNSSGNVLIGQSSAAQYNNFSSDLPLQIARGSGLNANIQLASFRNDAFGGGLIISRSRSATVGTNTIVQNNDYIGNLSFIGADGTNWIPAAAIECRVDGTPGLNDMPGRLVFSTTADGASSPTERLRISNTGTTTLTSAASTAPFIANISASEVARIDSSGRLLVGTSSNFDGSTLQVNGNISQSSIFQQYAASFSGGDISTKTLNITVNNSTAYATSLVEVKGSFARGTSPRRYYYQGSFAIEETGATVSALFGESANGVTASLSFSEQTASLVLTFGAAIQNGAVSVASINSSAAQYLTSVSWA